MGHTNKSIRKSSRKAVDGDARRTTSHVGLLPKEAYTVLRTYFTQVTRHPSKVQFDELVTTIRRIPGCEDYKVRKLRAYFKEKCRTEARAEARAQSAAEYQARNHTRATTVNIIGLSHQSPTISQSSITSSEPDPPSPRPSSSSSHIYATFPSHDDGVPTTFIDLTRWLQEQNARFVDLAPSEGLR